MNGMIGVDTNVLLYAFDAREPAKRKVARVLLRSLSSGGETSLLWQNLGEFLARLHRWRSQGWIDADRLQKNLAWVRRLFPIVMPVQAVLDRALTLMKSHTLSHWDAMLVAACVEANIDTLYTEDMGAPRKIESVTLVNPSAVAS